MTVLLEPTPPTIFAAAFTTTRSTAVTAAAFTITAAASATAGDASASADGDDRAAAAPASANVDAAAAASQPRKVGLGGAWRKRLGGMLVGSRTIHVLRTRTRLRKVDKSKVVFTEGAAIWQQGDDALYTDDAMRQRAAVRHNPEVLEYLHLWWTTALNSMKRSNAKALGGGEPRLSKQYYVVMMKKMYKAMIEEYDEEDAEECAEEDWEHDAGGADTLSREGFCDAIFETADTWTKTCEAAEYAAFLRALHARLAQLGPDGIKYFWKDDHAIEFDPQFDDEALQSPDKPRLTPAASPRRSLSPGRSHSLGRSLSPGRGSSSTRRAGAGARRGFGASGLHWLRLYRPFEEDKDFGARTELVHMPLGAALIAKTAHGERALSFSGEEWQGFGVNGLRFSHFVKALDQGKDAWFIPAAELESAVPEGVRTKAATTPLGRLLNMMSPGRMKSAKKRPPPLKTPRPDPGSRAPYFSKSGPRQAREARYVAKGFATAAPATARPSTSESSVGAHDGASVRAAVVNVGFDGPGAPPRQQPAPRPLLLIPRGPAAASGFRSAMNTSFGLAWATSPFAGGGSKGTRGDPVPVSGTLPAAGRHVTSAGGSTTTMEYAVGPSALSTTVAAKGTEISKQGASRSTQIWILPQQPASGSGAARGAPHIPSVSLSRQSTDQRAESAIRSLGAHMGLRPLSLPRSPWRSQRPATANGGFAQVQAAHATLPALVQPPRTAQPALLQPPPGAAAASSFASTYQALRPAPVLSMGPAGPAMIYQ